MMRRPNFYQSVAEGYRQNGFRHLANGDRYAAAGNIEFANGSWRKAKKNFDKANKCFQTIRVHPLLGERVQAAMDATKHGMEQALYGS